MWKYITMYQYSTRCHKIWSNNSSNCIILFLNFIIFIIQEIVFKALLFLRRWLSFITQFKISFPLPVSSSRKLFWIMHECNRKMLITRKRKKFQAHYSKNGPCSLLKNVSYSLLKNVPCSLLKNVPCSSIKN